MSIKYFKLIYLIKFFWNILKKNRKFQLMGILILNIFSAIVEIISIGSIMPFITAITNPNKLLSNRFVAFWADNLINRENFILVITILFISLNIFSAVVRYTTSYFTIRTTFNTGSDIGQELFRVSILQDYEFHTKTNSSNLISVISSKAGTIITNGVTPIVNIINNFILFAVIFLTLSYLNPEITFYIVLIFSVVYGCIIYMLKPIIKKEGEVVSQELDVTIRVLQEAFGGIREIILNNTQKQQIIRYNTNERELRNSQSKSGILTNLPKFIVEPLGVIILAIISYNLFIKNSSTDPLAELVLISLALQRLLPIMQQMFTSWSTLTSSIPALEDVKEYISLESKISNFDEKRRMKWNNSITLENIFFKYESRDKNILNGINLSIKKGQILGLIGKSGAGKSTIIDIISGLINPTKGNLCVDGVSLNSSLELSRWRNEIAVVSQRIFLQDCSLLENIAFGVEKNEINVEKVLESIELADLGQTVSQLPLGIDTTLGERGVLISGGQLQRIGIARAFYKNASVLILDEITSALDNDTENEILKSIMKIKENFTIIMISHKMSILTICDDVYEVSNGRISAVKTN